jgi:serpin B
MVSILAATLAAGAAPARSQGDDMTMLVAGNNAFAFDFYRQAAGQGDANLIFSPFSISQAFGMLWAAARADTAQQIADTMHYSLAQDELHPAFATLLSDLSERETAGGDGEGERLQLNIANALWAQQDFPFREAYIDLVRESYDGGLFLADFVGTPDQAREDINAWIEDETKEKIQDMLAPGAVGTDTRMVLVNAIYFNGAWLHPFEEFATQDDTFTLLDGSTVTVPMMSQQESLGYMQGEGFQAVELPYFGGDVAMLIVLPDAGQFEAVRSGLDADQFDAIREALASETVQLTMPRWEFESSLDLKTALAAMGMGDVFDRDRADLSGMFDPAAVGENLLVSAALHKAYIGVDEAGTEAAAATAIIVGVTSAPVQVELIELRLDRPFIYTIVDRQTGSILFLGQVMNPAG